MGHAYGPAWSPWTRLLEPVLAAVRVEAARVMRPDEGPEPDVFGTYRALLGPALPLQPLGRLEFYAACRNPTWRSASPPATTASTPTSR